MAEAKSKLTAEKTPERVSYLRELTLKLIRENGKWQKFGDTPVMSIKNHGNLSIVYLTPFQRTKSAKQIMGYSLEIRARRRVVLSLVWHTTGPTFCETYRPGDWEKQLEVPAVTASLAA
jgi:hypothetical protein